MKRQVEKTKPETEQSPFTRSGKTVRSPLKPAVKVPVGALSSSSPPNPFKVAEDAAASHGKAMVIEEILSPLTTKHGDGGISLLSIALEPASEVGALRQRQDDAEAEEADVIKEMERIVSSMMETLTVQKNVNSGIKLGLPKLEDLLSQLKQCRRIKLQAVASERKFVDSTVSGKSAKSELPTRKRHRGSSTGSPEAQHQGTLTISVAEKEPQTSPAKPNTPTMAKRTTDLGEAAPSRETSVEERNKKPGASKTPAQGDWKKQLTKSEKKKKRQAVRAQRKEMATKSQTATPVPAREIGSRSGVKKKRPKKSRSEAILIKPSEGRSFAEVLGQIRTGTNPEQTETVIKSIRRTQNGGVLLELGKSKDKAGFTAALKSALGEKGSVRALDPRISVEVRDLDGLSTDAEVSEAIKKAIPELAGESETLKVWLTKPNRSQQRMAIVEMNENHADKLLSLQHLKVGWVNCRLRRRVVVPRCFRCLGFGHSARNCKGPDRSKNCLRCGGDGHTRKECSSKPSCFLCKEKGIGGNALEHIPGSGQCGIFKAALDHAKGRS